MISGAFTCTGAYAILILAGIKRVENRSRLAREDYGVRGRGFIDHLIVGKGGFKSVLG